MLLETFICLYWTILKMLVTWVLRWGGDMWTRLVRISDLGQWFGKIHEPVTRVQHLVRTNSYVNATVSLVRRYDAVVCMKKRELIQDPDCTLALQHVLGHWSGLVAFTYTNPDLVREITRVISRCEHKLSEHGLNLNISSVSKLTDIRKTGHAILLSGPPHP